VLLGPAAAPTTVPVRLAQRTLGATRLHLAGLPLTGRILPLALRTFTAADIQTRPERARSQYVLERTCCLRLLEAAPRGLGRCFLLTDLNPPRASPRAPVRAPVSSCGLPGARFLFRG